ncbi:19604_t:CDS:1, partial [Racocetra persica]
LNLGTIYKDLRINLAWSLVEESLEMNEKLHMRKNKAKIQSELHNQNSEKKSVYVTKKFDLPIARLQPQSHYPEWREERGSCIWCRFQYMSEHGRHDKNSPQSYMWCTVCNVPLCINKQRPDCFIKYHEHK